MADTSLALIPSPNGNDHPGQLGRLLQELPQNTQVRPPVVQSEGLPFALKALMYPTVVLDGMGLLPRSINPFAYRMPDAGFETLRGIDDLGTYEPGPRESENVEDRRPASIWSWPR